MTATAPLTPLTPPSPDPAAPLLACLCAEWCGVCREFRALFEQSALANPQVQHVWIDVEDHPDVPGDLDVETFPTVLVSNAIGHGFLGTIEPRGTVLQALIDNLARGAFARNAQVAGVDQRARAHLAAQRAG